MWEWETPTVLGPVVAFSFLADPTEYMSPTPSPKVGSRFSTRNVVLFSVLQNTGRWTKS
jgi:hypothetical protein